MTDLDVRIKCLELASQAKDAVGSLKSDEIISLAKKMYDFATNKAENTEG